MKYKKFEELPIWKESLFITKLIYDITSSGLFSKDFGLRDQIRRAVVSISSNIVEGFEKNNNNEFVRYLKIAKGSAGEIRNQLYIAQTINYISENEFSNLNQKIEKLASHIGGLIVYLQNLKNKQSVIRNS